MKLPRPAIILGAVFGVFVLALVAVGPPMSRAPDTPPPTQVAAQPASISANGVTLASISVDFPNDDAGYPAGPHADVINANCTGCHSAAMALYQPRLSADAWRKEVEKMRTSFDAPVSESDVPAIVAYLTAMSAKLPVDRAGEAKAH